MKKIFAFLLVVVSINYLFGDEIDDIINKINNKREAKLPKKIIESTVSPMQKLVVKDNNSSKNDSNSTGVVINKESNFVLKAIMNNSANINGQWVKIGQKIKGFKLVDIMDDSVYLTDGNKSKMVFFDQNISKINIKLGR